ncbi:HAMP domain-containing sensor histidine kinase [Oceanobacillus jeddahense]|uniref:histidine kinase n=1 Tax=Oceanobacillus jeddahense TaxID=1462527 RepID=A0ABY5JM69_9BACI|nr:ATP-binding protein [Oceanobacillus jeddahense]UUI01231.1 ATP-binding protein [Oceanobacillus jeddahense]
MKQSIVKELIWMCIIIACIPLLIAFMMVQSNIIFIIALITTLPFFLFSFWMITYVRKRMITPLSILAAEAQKISQGNLSHRISYKKEDEFGRFITAFDQMRNTLYLQEQQQQTFENERKHFIDSISHDLKTPITSISAYIEALQDGIAESLEEEQRYLQVIQKKVHVLNDLSNQLILSYETPETVHLETQSINCYEWAVDWLDNILVECQTMDIHPQLENHIDRKDASSISIDVYQLDRALQNILNNAYRHMRDFLSIKISVDTVYFKIQIVNDGANLNKTHINRIFERFYTQEKHNADGHLGLGLYITATLIQAMDGEITAALEGDQIHFDIAFPIGRV